MAKKYSISFEQAADDTPLKILPKNTWVKINNFKNPCRLLEISAQSLTIDVKNEPETLTLHAGQSIKVQILNISEEKPFELRVTIFHINDTECLCQIPLYINNEQILVDKIILEIQKNEIGANKTPNSARKNKNADNADEETAPLVPTDENIAPILNNLIAMLPNETKDNKEEQVTASILTDIPKSTYNYQQVDLSKLFDDALEKSKTEQEEEEEYEFEDENEFDFAPAPKLPPRVHPLTLLRYSIVNKFLLDNLEDPYPGETAALEQGQLDISTISQKELEQGIIPASAPQKTPQKRKKIKERKKNAPSPDDIDNFLPSNLIEEMNMPDFMANIDKTNEYDYSLGNQKKPVDKDAAFEQYYEFSEDIPPELLFELMQKAKKRKEEYEGLDPKYQTDEYGFTVADEENFDGKNDDFVMGKFDDMLKNKRVIKWNMNEDPDFIAKTDEEKDEAFLEKLNSKNQDKTNSDKSTFNFKLDI